MDESRFGLQTIQRRCITLRGVKPCAPYQHRFENFYLYGAVCPLTGEGTFAVERHLRRVNFMRFLQELACAQPQQHHVLLLDNSKTHVLPASELPANVSLLFQPPYTPELNPIERVWQDAKRHLAWANYPDLVALQEAVADIFTRYSVEQLVALTAYPYLVHALTSTQASRSASADPIPSRAA